MLQNPLPDDYEQFLAPDQEHLNSTKNSQLSYGRKRGLPIEKRSQLWLAMKERKLEGQRSIKASKEVEGCTFEPNIKGKRSPLLAL